jgi:hypothetical protein
MRMEPPEQETLSQALARVKAKTGAYALSDDDVLILACAEIVQRYTSLEKGFLRQCQNNQPL